MRTMPIRFEVSVSPSRMAQPAQAGLFSALRLAQPIGGQSFHCQVTHSPDTYRVYKVFRQKRDSILERESSAFFPADPREAGNRDRGSVEATA